MISLLTIVVVARALHSPLRKYPVYVFEFLGIPCIGVWHYTINQHFYIKVLYSYYSPYTEAPSGSRKERAGKAQPRQSCLYEYIHN